MFVILAVLERLLIIIIILFFLIVFKVIEFLNFVSIFLIFLEIFWVICKDVVIKIYFVMELCFVWDSKFAVIYFGFVELFVIIIILFGFVIELIFI